MRTSKARPARLTWIALAVAAYAPAHAASEPADLSLEDLLKTEIVTVSRKSQSLQSTAAAAFVITREDIERSGAASIPEALRMAPGVEVARIANNRWAVSVRGFSGRFANKLLVLMDGRSIYSPLFSGVLWEYEDTLIEDVDRIEVMRGPGAALWGANAVNGVINIITRKARDTQGDLLVGSSGSQERALAGYRHGGEADGGHYRVWGKAFSRDPSVDYADQPGNDDWRAWRAGFRRDWSTTPGNRFTLSGEAYGGPTGDRWNLADVSSPRGYTPTNIDQTGEGAHLLGRREWVLDDGSESALQSYLDYHDINVRNVIHQKRTTFDLDYQRRSQLTERNDFIWGLGYRYSTDEISSQGVLIIAPQRRSFTLLSAFVQDEYTVIPETLRVIGGARLEHNSFTGFEPQPNLRMVWTPTPNQSVWGAASRAVRTPSRAEQDAQIDLTVIPANPPQQPFPVLTRNVPPLGSTQQSEKVDTLELGYRQQFGSNLSFDVAAFYSRYRDLRSAQLGNQVVVFGAAPYVIQEISPNNGVSAHTHGVEVAVDWHPLPAWRLQPSYSYLRMRAIADDNDPINQNAAASLGSSAPRHQLSLRSSYSPSARYQWDLWLRRVSALSVVDQLGNGVPAYTTLDARVSWRPMPGLELSLVGQNLLERRHAEFVPDLLPSQTLMVERSFYVKAKYQF